MMNVWDIELLASLPDYRGDLWKVCVVHTGEQMVFYLVIDAAEESAEDWTTPVGAAGGLPSAPVFNFLAFFFFSLGLILVRLMCVMIWENAGGVRSIETDYVSKACQR
jgi:hypothetical protein